MATKWVGIFYQQILKVYQKLSWKMEIYAYLVKLFSKNYSETMSPNHLLIEWICALLLSANL